MGFHILLLGFGPKLEWEMGFQSKLGWEMGFGTPSRPPGKSVVFGVSS